MLGMHRSGTSALTRGLEVLGVDLGRNLKEAVAGDNDKGFFEDWGLSTINDELLALKGGRWDSLSIEALDQSDAEAVAGLKLRAIHEIERAFGHSSYFAFKDPRTCRTLPFWKDVLARMNLKPVYVIAFRNPMSVADSLQSRDGFARRRSYHLWLLHTLAAVRGTEGERRIFVDYDALLGDAETVLARIAETIDDPRVVIGAQALQVYRREFLEEGLRRHFHHPAHLELDPAASPFVGEVYALLRREAENGVLPEEVSREAWAPMLSAFASFGPHLDYIEALDRDLRAGRFELETRNGEVKHLREVIDSLNHERSIERNALEARADALRRELEAASATMAHTAAALAEAKLTQESERAAHDAALAEARRQFEDHISAREQHWAALTAEAQAQNAELADALARERAEFEEAHAALRAAYEQTLAQERAALEEAAAAARVAHEQILAEVQAAFEQTLAEERASHQHAIGAVAEAAAHERAAYEQRLHELAEEANHRAEEAEHHLAAMADEAIEQERQRAAETIEQERRRAEEAMQRAFEHERREQEARRRADALEQELEQIRAQAQQRRERYEADIALLKWEFGKLADQLRAVYASSSWRMTKPMRELRASLSGGVINERVPELPPLSATSLPPLAAPAQTRSSANVGPRRRVHFTICAKNYLPIARACLNTSKRHHPDAEHYLVLCDEIDQGYNPATEPFGVVPVGELGLPNFPDMKLRYDVMEFSTAIKPFCFTRFFDEGADEVVYLDPDLYFLSPLTAVRDALANGADAVLTPHINHPIEDDKSPGDIDMLRAGVYNLGFLALRRSPDAERFARWWGERLRTGAVSDIARGLFTDQKWCDLLPCFVANVEVLHRPGYNLAYWNLMHRPVRREGETWTAGGEPISFVHFSGASFTDPNVFSKHQNRYDANAIGELRQLYDIYRDEVRANGFGSGPDYRYSFDYDARGRRMAPILRQFYREEMASAGPHHAPDTDRLIALANEDAPGLRHVAGARVTRLMHRIWASRPDLQAAFDLATENGQLGLVNWARHAMTAEYKLDASVYPLSEVQAEAPASQAQPEPQPAQPDPIAQISRSVLSNASSLRPIYRHLPTSWRQRAKVALTRSAYAQRARAAQAHEPRPGAALIGYARGELGMGEHVRMTAAAMACEGVPIGIVNISENLLARQEDRRFDHLHSDQADFRVNIFHVNADQLPIVTAGLGDTFLSGKRNIAYPFWELGQFPDDWMPQLNAMDELWAPTKFIQEALAVAQRPVVHMPVAVELAPGYEKWRRDDFGLPSEAFVFLFYFDLASFASRKNPVGVLEAFKLALASIGPRLPRDVRLVVKVISADRFPHEFARLQEMTQSVQGVMLMPDVFSADKIHGLVNCADAFVSLHRSEGFGRGPAEAMRLGKVAIATGYSGNMDYMNEQNSFPVPYHLRPVGADEYPYGAGQHWADPDVREAAAIMARLISDTSLSREIGRRASDYMAAHHSQDAIGRRYAERLKIIGALN